MTTQEKLEANFNFFEVRRKPAFPADTGRNPLVDYTTQENRGQNPLVDYTTQSARELALVDYSTIFSLYNYSTQAFLELTIQLKGGRLCHTG